MTYAPFTTLKVVILTLISKGTLTLYNSLSNATSRGGLTTPLQLFCFFGLVLAHEPATTNAAELKLANGPQVMTVSPFDVRNGMISDSIIGPMIVDPRQQDESRPGFVNSSLYHIFFLTYARRDAERGPEITIAAEPDTTGRELFLFDKTGLLSKAAPSSVTVDKSTFEAFKASHRHSNVDVLVSDSAGQSHHVRITSGGALDVAPLSRVTDHSECLNFPQRLRIHWDEDTYDVVILMPAVYSKHDGVVNPYNDDCIVEKIQKKNSYFADISLGDTFTPSSTNFYISSFHTIYVIPISFFRRDNVNNNNIVFNADMLNEEITKEYVKFSRGNNEKAECIDATLDCAQSILDDAMHALVR